MDFDKKNRRPVINVDLDGTLTNGEDAWKQEPTPHVEHINIIKKLYRNGYTIIVHTARPWDFASETIGWLIKNKVYFHGIYMQKGGSDCYLDDKQGTFEELELLCEDIKKQDVYPNILPCKKCNKYIDPYIDPHADPNPYK